MSLLEQDTTRKRRINKLFPEPEPEFNADYNKKYEIKTINDSVIYAKEAEKHLLGLYYLVSWKGYPKEKSTWILFSIVMHFWKIISTFQKDHPEKPTATFSPLNSAQPMAKSLVKPVKPSAKQKSKAVHQA